MKHTGWIFCFVWLSIWGCGSAEARNESFETGNFSKYPWYRFYDVVPWTVEAIDPHGGTYRAQTFSTNPGPGASELRVSLYCEEGTISFWHQVYVVSGSGQFTFRIDGELIDEWSSQHSSWEYSSYPVSRGTHEFTWSVSGDGTYGRGAALDDIVFPPDDTTPPSVMGLDPVAASEVFASANSLDVDVTFSEEVFGVGASDMELGGTASVGAGVGMPVALGGNVWRFPITGLASGNLDIDLAPDPGDIQDHKGLDLAPQPTEWSYTITVDTTPPTVIELDPADGSILATSNVQVDVTFSETVIGVDAGDLELSGSAAAGATVGPPVEQGGNTWRFPIADLEEGPLTIGLAPDEGDIQDQSGNDLEPRPTEWDYTIAIPPEIITISPPIGATVPSNLDPLHVDMTFSEPVFGVDASDMELSGSAAMGAVVGVPIDLGGNLWRFSITGLVPGTVDIDLAPDVGDIEDATGNSLVPRPTEWSYLAEEDVSAPVVEAVAPSRGSAVGIRMSNLIVHITFSERVVGVDATDLELGGSAAEGASVEEPVDLGENTWRFVITGLGVGTLEIDLAPDPGDIQDMVGKDLSPRPTEWEYALHVADLFYVNDHSTANDVWCTAPGIDGTGRGMLSNAPAATVQWLLDEYDLEPGNVVRIDTGEYMLDSAIVVADGGSSNSPIRFEASPGGVVMDRNDTTENSSAWLIQASYITLCTAESALIPPHRNGMKITGGYRGIYAGLFNRNVIIERIEVTGNADVGIRVFGENALLRNNLVHENGGVGIFLELSGHTLENNTVVSNYGQFQIRNLAQDTLLYNNLIGAEGIERYGIDYSVRPQRSDYNLFYTTAGAHPAMDPDSVYESLDDLRAAHGTEQHSISSDPRFMDASSGEFRLRYNSPCIDSGTSMVVSAAIDGTPRPLDGDGDGDARIDIGAYEYASSIGDTDGDTIPDRWEVVRGMDPMNPADAGWDLDNDSAHGIAEYIANTDPLVGASDFRIDMLDAANSCVVTFNCSGARMYSLQSRLSLQDGDWEGVPGATNIHGAASGTMPLTDTRDYDRRHYRIKVKLLPEEMMFPDADFDGMPNEWEALYGLDPYDPADAAGNPDGDSYNNLEEYRNGTNPIEAESG